MICFNNQTNTCFSCGMDNNVFTAKTSDNASDNTSEDTTKSKGTGLNHNDVIVNSQDSPLVHTCMTLKEACHLPDGWKLMVFNEKGLGGYTQMYLEPLIVDLENPETSWLYRFITFHSDKLPFNIIFAYEDLVLAKCVIDSKSDPLIIVDYVTRKLYSSAISDEEYVGNECPIITVYTAKLPISVVSSYIKTNYSKMPNIINEINNSQTSDIKNGLIPSGKRSYSTYSRSYSKHVSDPSFTTESTLNDNLSASIFRDISQYFENNKFKANKHN